MMEPDYPDIFPGEKVGHIGGEIKIIPLWLPIAEAPHDGTSVLGYGHGVFAVAFWWVQSGCWLQSDISRNDTRSHYILPSRYIEWDPTHFMPLPPGPEEGT